MKSFVLVLLTTLGWNVAAETLAFAPLPMEAQDAVVRQFKPMLGYLKQKAGVDLRFEYSTSYAEVIEKFRQGKVDLAYLGPLPYITLRDKFPEAEPLVHFLESSGQPSYSCAIVVNSESRLSPNRLKGKRVALTQPLSTCGYLATDGLLRSSGLTLEDTRYRYLDKHDEVALAVVRGQYDAGGLKTQIGRKYAHLGLTVIAETVPLPSFALVVNAKTVSPTRINALRQALVAIQPGTPVAEKAGLSTWGDNIRFGSVAASDRDYDPVRKLRARTEIPEHANF